MNLELITTIAISLVKTLAVIIAVFTGVAGAVLAERKVSAAIQDRVGPNRVGPFGIFQVVADGAKFLLKEDFTPKSANAFYYWLAPACVMVPALLGVAIVPFGSELFGQKMVIADVNVGILFFFAISSLGVYGIVMAGWASNSKYPFLGGIRSSAQMISYELALGLSVIPVFLMFGQLNLSGIVEWQRANGWLVSPIAFDTTGGGIAFSFTVERLLLWGTMMISAIVFMVSLFAETNRLPFDLPESETELVAGYHTEYSSMKFALFFLGEYAAMIAGSAIFVTLFLGGWSLPFVPDGTGEGFWPVIWGLVNIGVFVAKVAAVIFVFIWVRWTLPRFRYDQLMRLGWVWFFEIALANILIAAFIIAYWPRS